MATEDQRAALRRMVDDVSVPQAYDDTTLDLYIDDAGDDLRKAAAAIWREKAAKYVEMVDTQEGTSRRALGDMLEHALLAAESFEGTETPGGNSATTRAIERV